MNTIVDNVVSRARVEEGNTPLSIETPFTHSRAQDNKDNNSASFKDTAERYFGSMVEDFRLIQQTFQAKAYVVTPDGEYGTPPEWLDWPHHSAAEMGPPIQSPAELAAQSKAKRK